MTMIMKKTALLFFALCTGTVYTQYTPFESMPDLCKAVGKQSAKIKACLKKHCFFDLEPDSVEFVVAINDLIRVSEHELMHNQALKKQFISSLWLGRLEACYMTKDYVQAIAFCDRALDIDPDNVMIYVAKSELYKELGNTEQAAIASLLENRTNQLLDTPE
jgi:tetratricopeptide (TPR) repeat protein